MTIELMHIVDIISTSAERNEVMLTISDHLPWDEGDDHLLLLQEKLNSYLAFVESGELVDYNPAYAEKHVIFDLVYLHPPGDQALAFLDRAAAVVAGAGFESRHRQG